MSATSIRELLERDHARLSALLDASARGRTVDADAFHAFRGGLLRHIGMEEKILLPAIRELRGGEPLAEARQLKLDHAALAGLLVPSPTPAIVERLRALLEPHNALEEGDEGVYAACDRVAGARRAALLEALDRAPPPKLAPYQDGRRIAAHIEKLLRAAGRL